MPDITKCTEIPPCINREHGFYWIKKKDDEGWQIARFGVSWGIYGWWEAGEEMAFYDDDIDLVLGPMLEPEEDK